MTWVRFWSLTLLQRDSHWLGFNFFGYDFIAVVLVMGLCCMCAVACTERSEDPSTFRTWWSSRSSKMSLKRPLGCGPFLPSLAARRKVGAVPTSVQSHQSVQCQGSHFCSLHLGRRRWTQVTDFRAHTLPTEQAPSYVGNTSSGHYVPRPTCSEDLNFSTLPYFAVGYGWV